ncbi:MAG: thioredoxin-dependent thiol peroxidase [Bacteroidota bacterium]
MTTLQVGDAAPDFTGAIEEGKSVSLSDFRGQKLILFFYPKDDTPGCTAEACNLRDNYTELKAKGYALLGVSPDPLKKHAKFQDKYDLPFPLLSDEDHTVLNAYGVWGLKKFMGREYDGVHRTTFVIDEQGILEQVITKVKTKNHTAQILGEPA